MLGLGHPVENLEDGILGGEGAVFGFVFALDDGEGFHDVVHISGGDAVEMKKGGIKLTAQ